ncbi:RidA family protein [Candidatus Poriferisodalis sp.]|uniref:RidA family protein n=1 Tax=Candidatus Poriferisodalis sp. TaxID=3101277 RepID=UPI003B526556
MAAPIAHYSKWYRAGDFVFVSGQIGLQDGALADGVEAQAQAVLANVTEALAEAGGSLNDVVKCLVFMTDINNFSLINSVYAEAFGNHRPARSAIGVAALPLGAEVEIEAIAFLPE